MSLYLGIDTSNYTTSVAALDTERSTYKNSSRLLPVGKGALGLRQADAVFAHINALPERYCEIASSYDIKAAKAIGVSTKPREVEGSYMPCFLAGDCAARVISETLGIPRFEFSHQQGHIVSVLYAENRLELFKNEFLAWHLSGGTTELLMISPLRKNGFSAQKLGGTTDISAGQLIDRSGALLNLDFPSGKEIDKLALESKSRDFFRVRVENCCFSLSGMENQAQKKLSEGVEASELASFVIRSIAQAVLTATLSAFDKYGKMPVVMSGGVSGSRVLKSVLAGVDTVFTTPEHSSDNALGIAVYTAICSGGIKI